MSVKKVLMSKKIANVLYDIYPKTAADVVEYMDGATATTVQAALAEVKSTVAGMYTNAQIDSAIAAVDDRLTALIGGDVSLDEAFDTIKEISDYLSSGDGAAVAGLITDVANLKTTVGDATGGLVKDVADLQTTVGDNESGLVADMAEAQSDITALEGTVGDASSGLVKDMADAQSDITALETTVGDSNSGLVKDMADAQADITALEGTVGDASSGLVKDVADLKAVGAVKVEASTVNGNIKINGSETKVYDDSAIAATKITQDATHRFVADTDTEKWNAAAHILSDSASATDNDLVITELA